MYFVDTNIFLRFFVKENQKTYDEAKALLESVQSGFINAFTSDLVLAEVEWTLKSYYQIPKPERMNFIMNIAKLFGPKIINDFDSQLAIDFYAKHNIKFIDCLIASMPQIQSGNIVLISYDQDFDKLKVKRLEPKQVT